jgi:hypothetical protein
MEVVLIDTATSLEPWPIIKRSFSHGVHIYCIWFVV